jgi:arginase
VTVSSLRARCPHCRTMTAVALGPEYQCHSCGAEFGAGLVRVPRAWGSGGEAMMEAASLTLPYPETAVVDCVTLEQQTARLAEVLPERPLVLGGCCCAHTGAIRGLAARTGRLAVVWLDAHGDLNTPETSPSGNEWGMPLRAALDEGSVRSQDLALVGTRNLDPPEAEYMRANGIDDDVERALDGAAAVYVALDCDVLDPAAISCFFPEPDGPTVAEVEVILRRVAVAGPAVAGLGLTGLRPDADVDTVTRLARAIGL